MKNVEVNQELVNRQMQLEIAKNQMKESTDAGTQSSLTDIEASRFSKDEEFKFMPEMNKVYDSTMPNGKTRVIFVISESGKLKKFFPTSMRKAVEEVTPATEEGQLATPTGRRYVACHEDLDENKKVTMFYEDAIMFPNDRSMAEALAKNSVQLVVTERKQVITGRFNPVKRAVDLSGTARQNVMSFEYAETDPAKLATIRAAIQKAASDAVE